MLTQYQKNNLEKLREATKISNEVVVVGTPSSGRKYVIEQWANSIQKPIVLILKKTGTEQAYSSLLSALKTIPSFREKTLKITPSFSLTGILGSINAELEQNVLFKTEDEIERRLLRISKKHSIIFVIDKSFMISDDSIELIEKFKKKSGAGKRVYLIYVSDVAEKSALNIYFDDISSYNCSPEILFKELNLDTNIVLSDKVTKFILSNINNNIKLLIQIIDDINNKNLDCTLDDYDKNHVIEKLLNNANRNYEYREKLNDLLSICAISEHYFQSIDFAYLLDEHESVINLLLEYAQRHYVLEEYEDSFRIYFGIVNKIYASLDEVSKRKLYVRILNMIENIHPSEYYQKYLFSNLAEVKGGSKYLVQYLFSEIRLNHGVNFEKYKSQLSEKEFNLVNIYNKAVGYSNRREYDKCVNELKRISELNSELLYEINILKSQVLIKKMDFSLRKDAISLLHYDESVKDENLKFRLNIRKIAAYVHMGQHEEAFRACQHTVAYLLDKLEETNSIEYEYYINIIYRKYSYVSEYDTSINEVKKSVEFFRKNQNDYYKGYYIALINLLSLYIINMQLEKAAETKKELEDLLLVKNHLSFPRKEIMENNFILFNYFCNTKDLVDICNEFKKLHDDTKGAADNILIASNYSIFLMLNGELELAEKILLDLIPNTVKDLEGIYDSRVKINLAICKFLTDNRNRENCIKMLDSVYYNEKAPYYRVRTEELANIKKLMSSIGQCNDANKWCEAFKQNISSPLSLHTTYQQGFVFTTLFNWDDD